MIPVFDGIVELDLVAMPTVIVTEVDPEDVAVRPSKPCDLDVEVHVSLGETEFVRSYLVGTFGSERSAR